MPPIDPGLKEAVWLLLEITAHQQPGQTIHSDFIVRKFPKVHETDILNTVGALVKDGKITVKASSVDAHGGATAYHIRVKGFEDVPAGTTPAHPSTEFAVGFGDTKVADSDREKKATEPPRKVGLSIKDEKVDIRPDTGGAKEEPRPPDQTAHPDERVLLGTGRIALSRGQQEADQNFADEVASFFAELEAAPTSRESEKRDLIDQVAVLMAMFQSADAENFTTPVAKLAALKTKVNSLAPELVPDYVLLCQTALRAWLGRV